MRNIILSVWIVLGCLMLTTVFSVQPKLAVAEEKTETMPLDLDGSKWAIEVTVVEKSDKKSTNSDILVFEDNQFFSETFRKEGYEPTNYSVSLKGDGSTKFGTMQNKDKKTVYWEGWIKAEVINGSIYVYSKKGRVKSIEKEYYFKGKLSSGTLKRKSKPKPVVQKPVASAPVVKKDSVQSVAEDVKKPKPVEEESQPNEDK